MMGFVFFFTCFWSELIVLVGMLNVYFFFLFGLLNSKGFSYMFFHDLLGSSMGLLTVLIFVLMLLSGSFDFLKGLNWVSFLILLFIFYLSLLMLFSVNNFLFFYLMFELVVVPIFVVILGWGYSLNRSQAAIYMFLYTFFFSLPLLAVIFYFHEMGLVLNFFLVFFMNGLSLLGGVIWVFFLFIFMVKLPVFLLHLWLPSAHVEAPLLGSMVLAGVLLKLGGYGVYSSISYFFFNFFSLMFFLAFFLLFSGFIVSLICFRQVDLKSLIAYSSVVHMAPVLCSLMVMGFGGFLGSYYMMFSHGVCSSMLFFLLNLSYMKLGSRSFLLSSGGLFVVPFLSFVWFFYSIANMGFPLLFNFFSELLLVVNLFFYSSVLAFPLFFMMLLGGFYSVMIYTSYNHGVGSNYSLMIFMSMKDLLISFLSLVWLVGFIYVMSTFICW